MMKEEIKKGGRQPIIDQPLRRLFAAFLSEGTKKYVCVVQEEFLIDYTYWEQNTRERKKNHEGNWLIKKCRDCLHERMECLIHMRGCLFRRTKMSTRSGE